MFIVMKRAFANSSFHAVDSYYTIYETLDEAVQAATHLSETKDNEYFVFEMVRQTVIEKKVSVL